jgi:tRNA A-37 threonylcarbamoyl transferase component Bud32
MLSDPLLGRVIDDKYQIEAEIGAGGMATIYRATRLKIGDVVAIKILHSELLREPKFAERFQREAQAAARLKHPNVVTVHDFGVSDDGVIYLVMELVEGRNLRAMIKDDGPMPTAMAAEIIRQVCAALTEAHRQNTIHRDIKPANIAVTPCDDGPRVKVLDFGIASLRGGTMMTFTQTGTVMGTPAYMSPEQCLGEDLDGRSDIYSVGVVLFEMLCGVVPFNSPTATAVVMQHVQQAPPPLRVLNVSVSPAVEAVVLRALAKRREDRQQSAKQLADELSAAVAGTSAPLYTGARGFSAESFSPSHAAMTMVQPQLKLPAASAAPARRGQGLGIIIGLAAAAVLVALGFGAQRVLSERLLPADHAHRPAHTTAPLARTADARPPVRSYVAPATQAVANDAYQSSVPFVNEYYRLWNARQYSTMYGMLSARMQRKNPYDQYVKYHSLVAGLGVNATPGYAPNVVNVHIVSRDHEKDGSITENVNEGQWFLTTEAGQLKLDAQDAHDVSRGTVVAAPPPVVAAPVVAAPVVAAPAFDPQSSVNFVLNYYRYWNAREYATMYGMLSSGMQRKHPYDGYLRYHAMVMRIQAEAAPTYSPWVVNVRIVSEDREKDGSITQAVNEGQWYLTQENGTLKLADQKVHEVK